MLEILLWILIALACIGLAALLFLDIAYGDARVRRCYRCGHRSLRMQKPDEGTPSSRSSWTCTRCGYDSDEFGNRL